jgi:hypothetical protein
MAGSDTKSFFTAEDFLELRGPGQGSPMADIFAKVRPEAAAIIALNANAKVQPLQAEVDRLRAELAQCEKDRDEHELGHGRCAKAASDLRIENHRLRDALDLAIEGNTLSCTACDDCGLCLGCENHVRGIAGGNPTGAVSATEQASAGRAKAP